MFRNLHLLLVSVLFTAAYSFSQSGLGSIRGSVIDGDTGQPLGYTKVLLKQNGNVKGGANTDDDGKFQINSLAPGSYDVEFSNSAEGYQASAMTGVIVNGDRITFLDNVELSKPKNVKDIDEMVVTAYRVPLIDKDGGASGATVTREDINRLPVRSAAGVAMTVGGVNTDEGSGDISVRGSRSDASYYYIDGIKVRGSSNLPKSAIEEVAVITGGLPANYGDVTGGVISITTRGPSAKYFGSIEGVTSGFYFKGKDKDGYDGKSIGLDRYAYNLVEGMFSGPLFMKKDSLGNKVKPILGFLVSASYLNELDNRPLNGGSYRVKQDVRDSLMVKPLVLNASGDGTFYASSLLRQNDFELTKYRMNAQSQTISAQAKIDVNTGPSVNLSFGGSMNYHDRSLYNRNSSLFNFQNFGERTNFDWRVFGRLTQRFSNNKEGSASKIKSANYSLMVDYSQSRQKTYDPKHGFNLFNYGHVGTFRSTYDTSLVYVDSLNAYVQQARPFQNGVTFEASETNPGLASVTNQYYNLFGSAMDNNQIRNGNGLLNGDLPISVYNIWNNLGSPYNGTGGINGLGIVENNQFRVTGSGSISIGDHAISLGFEYEQRTDRGWGAGDQGPVGLWSLARLLQNSHISEIDVTRPTIIQEGAYRKIYFDRLNTGYAYNNGGVYGGAQSGVNGGQVDYQTFFDYSVRKELGLDPGGSDILDIDSYDPSMFNYSMFSADELFNNGNSLVSYYGFDHTGKKVKGRTDIEKYFSEFDENGNYRRFIGAFQPTYISGYIMDKFAFRDLVFNIGVRVDVFDANQPVLRDKYLVYSAYNAGEIRSEFTGKEGYEWANVPSSMGDDYTVYVDDVNAPGQINGFRIDDTWFNANGDPIEDPKLLRGSNGIAPWLREPNNKVINKSAFEDYKAQVSIMPRIAFSFPVSEESSFFAHYDVLTKRPTSAIRFDPYEYQFLQMRTTVPINNSNLKPEKTIDYELGFQQVLTRSSSIKISAFYREQRDNVQMINVVEAYPATYRTFGNRDFGTVKGLTVAYDLRRTGNIRMTAAYTLQFADGTGSDATSMSGLIAAGLPNLRAIFPYSFDQRHAFAIMFDYRYGSGADYNGPRIKDFEVFGNMGLNIMTNIYSGNPYSRKLNIVNEGVFNPIASGLDGTTNGSRLPWSYRLDLQIDRTFEFTAGKTEDKKRPLFFNVYLRITNLFNQQNILSVYRATGNWNDDGYLEAADSQASIQSQVDEQSFRDYYIMKIQNPFNISAPRTIRLGVKFDF